MTRDNGYAGYISALVDAVNLPNTHAARIDSIERQARDEIARLDRQRHEGARRWTELRDTSSRLSRRVNDLAGQVGAPSSGTGDGPPLPASAIPAALESLRTDLDNAERSWQWVLRHRDRVRQMTPLVQPAQMAPPPPPPTSSPPPVPARAGLNPTVLMAVGAVLIVVLVIVIVAMAA